MSQQQCAVKDCKRSSRTICQCCNQNLCRDHFNQHDDMLNSQLNPLTDEINALSDRLSAIKIERLTNESRKKLDKWRSDCYKIIDQYYEMKCIELEQFIGRHIDEQREAFIKIRSKMNELIENQETTKRDIQMLTTAIGQLQNQMNQIENTSCEIEVHPLVIDRNLIKVKQPYQTQITFTLSNLSSPYQIKNLPNRLCDMLCSNERFLMVYIEPCLYLINHQLEIIKDQRFNSDSIKDICWSLALNQFILVCEDDIFLIDENTMSIEPVRDIKDNNWWTGTCSNTSLYLSKDVVDSSIYEFDLLPSIRFKTVHKINNLKNHDERIDSIVYNNETLALTTNNESNQTKYFELRSLKTFSLIWSLKLTVEYDTRALRCCLLPCNEWLVADWYTSSLFHITNEGKMKEKHQYKSEPLNINLFRSNMLLIGTRNGVHFHKL